MDQELSCMIQQLWDSLCVEQIRNLTAYVEGNMFSEGPKLWKMISELRLTDFTSTYTVQYELTLLPDSPHVLAKSSEERCIQKGAWLKNLEQTLNRIL